MGYWTCEDEIDVHIHVKSAMWTLDREGPRGWDCKLRESGLDEGRERERVGFSLL